MRQAGFTLLEILVALVVLGFLIAGLSQGVRFGLQSWEAQTRRIAVAGDMDAIDRALRRLIEDMQPGDQLQPNRLQGTAHTIVFQSRLPLAATAGAGRDADVALGVDDRHRLVLRSTPHPHAARLAVALPATQTVLLEHIDHVDFGYWRGTGKAPGWTASWGDPQLPGLVRVRIAFIKGDRRHWTDLLAAPMLDRRDD